jgi:dihydroneopterin aldolase/2-amino-4-hydroxy-6-hydroxymethyldihydropteridine diphosphokinase
MRAFVSLGSNLEPEDHLRQALRLLGAQVRLVALSTVYRTPPLGRPEQPDFFNAVAEVATDLPPRELRARLREIEARLGRVRTADKFAPRTIDLDLIVYENVQEDSADLHLPDPEIAARNFLAGPLAELAPDLRLPGSAATAAELAAALSREGLTPLPEYTRALQEELPHEP